MGTNYYRIPKKDEFAELRKQLMDAQNQLTDFQFATSRNSNAEELIDYDWKDEEGNKLIVHLGKRSGGWKFLWNFHRNKFYSNKEELFAFIRSGRVFNEYGEELDPEEFIDMAINWDPKGWDSETYPEKSCYNLDWHDTFIDGLRISTPQEHSTYFC